MTQLIPQLIHKIACQCTTNFKFVLPVRNSSDVNNNGADLKSALLFVQARKGRDPLALCAYKTNFKMILRAQHICYSFCPNLAMSSGV